MENQMTIYYSGSTNGFYNTDVHERDSMPSDIVEITVEDWELLLSSQELGKSIIADPSGYPILQDFPSHFTQEGWDKQEYIRGRTLAYPTLQEQADMQYWDAVNGTTRWQDTIAKVKDKFPKP